MWTVPLRNSAVAKKYQLEPSDLAIAVKKIHFFYINSHYSSCVHKLKCSSYVKESRCLRKCSYRSVLALDAGAVESDRGNALDFALDVKDALIVLLSRLRLGQVSSSQCDWPNDPRRYQDVAAGQNLRAALKNDRKRQYVITQAQSKAQIILTHKHHNWFDFHWHWFQFIELKNNK